MTMVLDNKILANTSPGNTSGRKPPQKGDINHEYAHLRSRTLYQGSWI
jgi:hypothetical protein